MRSGLLALCTCLLATLGCAHSPMRASLSCPARSGPPWAEYESAHFVVRSDLTPAAARAAVLQYEQIFRAFQDVSGFAARAVPAGRMSVILFDRHADFDSLAPAGVLGFFAQGGPDGLPFMALVGHSDMSSRQVFQHELTHRFVRLYVANGRPWLHEGMGEFYSTLEITDGTVRVGGPPFRLRGMRAYELPSVEELVARDSLGALSPDKRSQFYAGSWMLVHVMLREYRPRFQSLVGSLGNGASFDEAWTRSFATLPAGELESRYRASLRQLLADSAGSVPVFRIPYQPPAVAGVLHERPLSDGEVHILWATTQQRGLPAYRAQLDLAAEHDGPTAELHQARVFYHLAAGELSQATAEAVLAAQARPDDERSAFVLAGLHLEAAGNNPDRLAALEPELQRLAARARSVEALQLLGHYYVARNLPALAQPFVNRAIQSDPTCAACFDTLAMLMAEKGDLEHAVRFAERALHLLPDGVSDRIVSERLAQLRRLRERAQPSAAH